MSPETKAAIERVSKEPCSCVRCGECRGTGNVRVDGIVDYDLETCEECGGYGITETCDRCQLLVDLEHEDE